MDILLLSIIIALCLIVGLLKSVLSYKNEEINELKKDNTRIFQRKN